MRRSDFSMRVGIDARALQSSHRFRGIGSYVRNLMLHLPAVDASIGYYAFVDSRAPLPPELASAQVTPIVVRQSGRGRLASLFIHQWLHPRLMSALSLDAFHFPYVPTYVGDASIPFRCPCPLVVTVHDLIPLRFAADVFTSTLSYHFYRATLRRIRSSAHVIANSRHTQEDLVDLIGMPRERISVTHEAASRAFHPVCDESLRQTVMRRYGIVGRYLLYVGDMSALKNVGCLLEAFALVRSMRREEVNLVLSGRRLPRHDVALRAMIKRSGVEGSVLLVGFVPEDDLVVLYGAAELFVFPSRFEGFGLPLLEAMACGTPVAASRVGAIPEVVGEAAVLFDPNDPRAIAEAVLSVLDDRGVRERTVARGIEQAARYSWESTAAATVAVYRQAAGQTPRWR